MKEAITNGPQELACYTEMKVFIPGEIQRSLQDGFSISLSTADMVRMFGEKIKFSCITEVPQAHHQPRLILNLLEKPDEGTPSVNNNTKREVSPEYMQFGQNLPRILQAIWEADLDKGLTWVSKLDVTDTYHRGTLRPYQLGPFAYIIQFGTRGQCCYHMH